MQNVHECTGEQPLEALLDGAADLVAAITSNAGAPGALSATLTPIGSSAPNAVPAHAVKSPSSVSNGSASAPAADARSSSAAQSSAAPEPAIAGLSLGSQSTEPQQSSGASAAGLTGPAVSPKPSPAPRAFSRTAASSGPRFVGRMAVQSLAGDSMRSLYARCHLSTIWPTSSGRCPSWELCRTCQSVPM